MSALTSLSKLNIQYDKYVIELGNNQYSAYSFENTIESTLRELSIVMNKKDYFAGRGPIK
jgi:hypothetical protein